MNKQLNEDLEVSINTEISKSFAIAAQIFDELNDVDQTYENYRKKRTTAKSPVNKTSSKKEKIKRTNETFASENTSLSSLPANIQKPTNTFDFFQDVDLEKPVIEISIASTSQSRILRGYREYKIRKAEQDSALAQQNDEATSTGTQSYLSKIASSIIGSSKQ